MMTKKYRKLRTNESKDDYNRAKQNAIHATKKARTDFETRIANNIKETPKEFYFYANNKTTIRSEIAVLLTLCLPKTEIAVFQRPTLACQRRRFPSL